MAQSAQLKASELFVREKEKSDMERGFISEQIKDIDDMLKTYECPISFEILRDPVTAEDGHTYERKEIEDWLKHNKVSPMTRAPIGTKLITNYKAKTAVQELGEKKKKLEARLKQII